MNTSDSASSRPSPHRQVVVTRKVVDASRIQVPFKPPRHRRVVVTGIGLVTPFACDRETSWQAILQGDKSVRRVEGTDRTPCWIGAPAPSELWLNSAILGDEFAPWRHDITNDPVIAMALQAAFDAVTDAALNRSKEDADRRGCVIGTSKPGLRSIGRALLAGPDFEVDDWSRCWPNSAAQAVAQLVNANGPLLSPVAACATGLVSILRGADLIRSDECDVVLAGSSDASLTPIVLGSFQRLGVLAREGTDPATACRPFDASRSGFVIGEGAAVLVLESLDSAVSRDAKIYAELLTGGMACDPSGITQVDPEGTSLSWLISDVLHRAGLTPAEINYINLHGTATRANDVAETRAVRTAFGSAANRVLCSSQKGAIGHLLGAAGSVETALTLLAIRDQVAPPTVNLTTPDPHCDLDYVPETSRPTTIRHAMKLSLGFGGHLAAAVFRRLEKSKPGDRE